MAPGHFVRALSYIGGKQLNYSRRTFVAGVAVGSLLPVTALANSGWGGGWPNQSGSRGPTSRRLRFLPEPPKTAVRRQHHIEVNFSANELAYYRNGQPVQGYAVVCPASTSPKRGRVYEIDANPDWIPTPAGRRVYVENGGSLAKLNAAGGRVPHGDPLNPMGNYKFNISGFGAVRIHGTAYYEFDYENVNTLGCVRLMNGFDGIDELVALIGASGVQEGIDAVFF